MFHTGVMNIKAPTAAPSTDSGRGRITQLWSTVRADARAHRTARAEHRMLRQELAAYKTPTEIHDLLVAVEAAGEDAADVRDILQHNLVDYHRLHVGRIAC